MSSKFYNFNICMRQRTAFLSQVGFDQAFIGVPVRSSCLPTSLLNHILLSSTPYLALDSFHFIRKIRKSENIHIYIVHAFIQHFFYTSPSYTKQKQSSRRCHTNILNPFSVVGKWGWGVFLCLQVYNALIFPSSLSW